MPIRRPDDKVVTVFGGTGFVGRHLVRRLAKRGWRVRAATRNPDRGLYLRPMGSVGQVTPILGDIRDDRLVAAALHGADFAVNLVGVLAERRGRSFAGIHVEGARRVARLAREAGATRLVHVSALGAAPDAPSRYARSKAAGERAVLEAFPGATILRPSLVFGPEDSLFNRFGRLARLLPALPLFGGGHTRFQPVYVGDVAGAIVACLDDPATQGRTFELGGPKVYSFKELMRLVLDETRRRRLLVPVPWPIARVQAALLGLLPGAPITSDQLAQLRADNVVGAGAPSLQDLGIAPTAVEVILPTYMDLYRRGGRFAGPIEGRAAGGEGTVSTTAGPGAGLG